MILRRPISRTASKPSPLVVQAYILDGWLYYRRANAALSSCDIDHLQCAWLLSLGGQVYWHLIDQHGYFVLLPESTPGLGELRRYLARWRGFNYDAVCRFDAAVDTRVQLWPLVAAVAA